MKLKTLILLPLAGITLSVADPCTPVSHGPREPTASDVVYEVATLQPQLKEMSFDTQGTGHFMASDQVVLKSETTGVIDKVLVGEGDLVNPGDTLCTFMGSVLTAELAKKQAEAKEAEAQLAHDQKDSELIGQAPVKPKEATEPVFLDEDVPLPSNQPVAQPASKSLENPSAPPSAPLGVPSDWASKLTLDQAHVDKVHKEVEELQAKVADLSVVASIGGTIKRRYITPGTLVSAQEPLFEIVNTNPVTVIFNVPQDVSAYVDKQLKVKASPTNAPEVSGEGPIFYISPAVDPVTHTMEIKAHISNDKGLMKDGEEARATLTTRKIKKVLLLPKKAVVQEADKSYVYFVNGRQAKRIEAFVAGQPDVDGLVMVDTNLGVDDEIIVSGQDRVKDGSFVKVVKNTPAVVPTVPAGAY